VLCGGNIGGTYEMPTSELLAHAGTRLPCRCQHVRLGHGLQEEIGHGLGLCFNLVLVVTGHHLTVFDAQRRGEQPRASAGEPRSARLRSSTSAARLPASRVPSTMKHAKYDDLIGRRVEVDRVWKATDERPACLALDARVRERGLDDTGNHHIDFCREESAKPRTLFLVPVAGVEQFCLRLRAENKTWCHAPRRSFRRTSSQGMAEAGSAMCSARRRSSSARCSGVKSNSASCSAWVRLSQRAIAISTRSAAGSPRSFVKVSLNMYPILPRPTGLHKVLAAANARGQRPASEQREDPVRCTALFGSSLRHRSHGGRFRDLKQIEQYGIHVSLDSDDLCSRRF
jgi:hypothetical protein